MQQVQEQAVADVGHFDFEVYGSGREGRRRSSRFQVRCDALGFNDNQMLLLSVAGAETSIKALTAGLRASGRDQTRIDYSADVGSICNRALVRTPDGYHIHRTRLAYGLWHVLCLAKTPGFLPNLTDDTVWQWLRSEAFTTPLLREWVPWLCREMKARGMLKELEQSGCHAGIVQADTEALDKLVTDGIRRRGLRINDQVGNTAVARDGIDNLDGYMHAYGPILGKQAERSLTPLHVPGRDALPEMDLVREPFEAQRHVIEASRRALQRQKTLLLVGEMGTGKTIMGLAAAHAHANGRSYRGLVFCPGQLMDKWGREIRETIPDARVHAITTWKHLLHLNRGNDPAGAEWYVIARDRAKLGARWQPAYVQSRRDDGFIRCPQCGRRLVGEDRVPVTVGKPAKDGKPGTGLWKRRSSCEWVLSNPSAGDEGDTLTKGCGSPLWQMNGEIRRYEPALYVKRRLRHFFRYLILDEVHEEKGADTAQGHAAGALAAACRKVIALTGTLIGGYAEHLRPLLFRLSPRSLIQEGLGWSNVTAFNERYGRIETRITERSAGGGGGEDNRMSRGSKSTVKSVRPGIMPGLFGRHLIDKAVFLSLSEVADNLPPLEEECMPVAMDRELETAYRKEVEEPLADAIKEMMKRRDRRLLGTMVQTLLAYPDYPFGWEPIGYHHNGGKFVTVAEPPHLPENVIRSKERALIDLVQSEKAQRRKLWVYVQFTDRHDVQGRLECLLTNAGFRVGVLRASVTLDRREAWIAEHAPNLDVVISHPRLVETGLDLFDKAGRHNFPTICFYETGYGLFTLRQASRRSWRIGQRESCRIVYLYYEGTMQDRAMALMGRKLTAAQALEGRFSTEGLVAMAGEDANVEIALARSLVERMDEGDARRAWNRVAVPDRTEAPPSLLPPALPRSSPLPLPTRPRTARRPALVVAGAERQPGWLF